MSLSVSLVSLALSIIALSEKVFGWTPRAKRAAQPIQHEVGELRVPWHRIRHDKKAGMFVIPGWGLAAIDEEGYRRAKKENRGWLMRDITPTASDDTNWVPVESFPL